MIINLNIPKVKKQKFKLKHKHKIRDFNFKFDCENYRKQSFYFVSKTKGYLTLKQIIYIKLLFKKNRKIRKKFKIFTPLLVNYNPTKRSERSRMGKGKGKPTIFWFISVSYGTVLFEFSTMKRRINFLMFEKIIHELNKRLPIRVYLKLINF